MKKLHNIYEIINLAKEQKSKKAVLEILKFNWNLGLHEILKLNYDKNYNIELTDGELNVKDILKYNQRPIGLGDTTILSESKRLYVFRKSAEPNMKEDKRRNNFIVLLQALDLGECSLLINAKNKKIKIPYISAEDLNEIFPGVIDSVEEKEAKPTEPKKDELSKKNRKKGKMSKEEYLAKRREQSKLRRLKRKESEKDVAGIVNIE